jgi:hypothetical protein
VDFGHRGDGPQLSRTKLGGGPEVRHQGGSGADGACGAVAGRETVRRGSSSGISRRGRCGFHLRKAGARDMWVATVCRVCHPAIERARSLSFSDARAIPGRSKLSDQAFTEYHRRRLGKINRSSAIWADGSDAPAVPAGQEVSSRSGFLKTLIHPSLGNARMSRMLFAF